MYPLPYNHIVADFATNISCVWGFMLKYANDEHSGISASSDKIKKRSWIIPSPAIVAWVNGFSGFFDLIRLFQRFTETSYDSFRVTACKQSSFHSLFWCGRCWRNQNVSRLDVLHSAGIHPVLEDLRLILFSFFFLFSTCMTSHHLSLMDHF